MIAVGLLQIVEVQSLSFIQLAHQVRLPFSHYVHALPTFVVLSVLCASGCQEEPWLPLGLALSSLGCLGSQSRLDFALITLVILLFGNQVHA